MISVGSLSHLNDTLTRSDSVPMTQETFVTSGPIVLVVPGE